MTQELFWWALVAGLVVLTWVMALAGLDDEPHAYGNLQGSASPDHHDGEQLHEGSPRERRVAS